MIISKIIGGLGNQMFQYAAGRSLSLATGCQLKIDISGFDNYTLHNGFELGVFNISGEIANPNEVIQLTGSHSKVANYLKRNLRIVKKTHFIERDFFYNPKFFQVKQPVYLDGYWQAYEYSQTYEAKIRSEFTFRGQLDELNYEISKQICTTNSVSVHVRRGDYLSNSASSVVHGFIGTDYYNKAIQLVKDRVSSPHFFVFSDDINWAKSNLPLNSNAVFVSHNTGLTSFEDMRLMSMCKHNVIANSTFSWWGAWLNINLNKIVVAPKNWFADRTVVPNYNKFIEDLILPNWILI